MKKKYSIILLITALFLLSIGMVEAAFNPFSPIASIIEGLFKLITDDPSMWLRIILGVITGVFVLVLANLIPGLKDSFSSQMVLAIAAGLGATLIFKATFIAGTLGAFILMVLH